MVSAIEIETESKVKIERMIDTISVMWIIDVICLDEWLQLSEKVEICKVYAIYLVILVHNMLSVW